MQLWIDLDKTIWNCYNGYTDENVWAKQLTGNLKLQTKTLVRSESGNYCSLDLDFTDFCKIYSKVYDLNIISAGGLQNVSWKNQPSVKLLRKFKLLKYFNTVILDYKTLDKSSILENFKADTIVLIDDDDCQLSQAKKKNIFTVPRHMFVKWTTLPRLLP